MANSNSLPGNPHMGIAGNIDNHADIRTVEAILALAHEQRTANLIALMQPMEAQGEVYKLLPEQAEQILLQINARMGF